MPASFARSKVTKVTVHATPRAVSLTLIGIRFTPFHTPLGNFLLDPSTSLTPGVLRHDAQGSSSFDVDLRGVAKSFVGERFVMQSFSLDAKNNLGVSGPRFGVLGN